MLDISTLNKAQQQAVTSRAQSLLIIAGAGSGKTRTLIYRLAWLIEQGVGTHNMLLLTFTRKAASQMLERASLLINQDMRSMRSGTFHAFAFSILSMHPKFCFRHAEGKIGRLSLLDSADQSSIITQIKSETKIAKGDRSFPKSTAIISMISKARNKELNLEELLRLEKQSHLSVYSDDLESLALQYQQYKRTKGLYDYDDLLFELDTLFKEEEQVLKYYQDFYPYIMVDEYQDTNKVQARLIRHLAGTNGNVMAVGDDAQSIYAFRGATVRNILDFPKLFPNTETIYLEENYRSYQPILDVANAVLSQASEGYKKHLFSNKNDILTSAPVRLYKVHDDARQALVARQHIQDLLLTNDASEITVLFRSGYHSFLLETELKKVGIEFKKVGGMELSKAAHVKDFLSYAFLIHNPLNNVAFTRIASFAKGVGAKTAQKLYELSYDGEEEKFKKQLSKYPEFEKDMLMLNSLRTNYYANENAQHSDLYNLFVQILEIYKPHISELYTADEYPKRLNDLEELLKAVYEYPNLDLFLADYALETSVNKEEDYGAKVTLSTIHSAKGLEWDHVLILDLADGRFPSSKAKEDNLEEEIRLMYVACTRARKSLALFVPQYLRQRSNGQLETAFPSPLIHPIPRSYYEEYKENIGGGVYLNTKPTEKYYNPLDDRAFAPSYNRERIEKQYSKQNSYSDRFDDASSSSSAKKDPKKFGYCTHKIFGRGKILDEVDNDKYKINFQNIGVKTILKAFVTLD